MGVRARFAWRWLALVVAAVGLCRSAHAVDAPDKPVRLTAEQNRALAQWLAEFRKPRQDAAARAAAAEKILNLGPVAARRLEPVVAKELRPALQSYSSKFAKRAADKIKAKASRVEPAEVQKLRSQVLSLRTRQELTKQMIVDEADPAVARLGEMLLLDRKAVLDGAAELGRQREQLLALGKIWSDCQQALRADEPARSGPASADREEPPASSAGFDDYLRGEEELAVQLALPMDARTRGILAANAALAGRLDVEEQRAILACNLTRALLGLSVLSADMQLCAAARDHSADMERLGFFAHQSPVEGKSTPYARAQRLGTTASAENIYRGRADGRAINDGWFHSPGHHKNLLGDHQRVGLGRSGQYFTQMFGK